MSVLNYGPSVLKYYFGLFCNFGRLVISSVFQCELFRIFGFRLILVGFLVSQEGYTLQHFDILAAFRRPNISREHCLAFFIEFYRHTFQQ